MKRRENEETKENSPGSKSDNYLFTVAFLAQYSTKTYMRSITLNRECSSSS
ncbi:unnamed protein product, partial [Callosobruchus maculatus]